MRPLTVTDVRVVPGDSGFLIDDGATAILYDTGFGFTGRGMAKKLKGLLADRSLDYIFLTHSHYDHALGAAAVAREFPGVRIVAGSYSKTIFDKPSARAVMRELDQKAALPYDMAGQPDLSSLLRVDIPVEDGDRIVCGTMEFTAVALPGHTRCSMGFYLAENRLLLSCETLGVYFGNGVCLPSYLVSYEMTMASFQRAMELEAEQILLPHYGLIQGKEARRYLPFARETAVEVAQMIRAILKDGKSHQEAMAVFKEKYYLPNVAPTYPIDAFTLNTGIMIRMLEQEQ